MIITIGSTGQISAVTFFAKKRKKAAIKNLLGEPGVSVSAIQLKDIVHILWVTPAFSNIEVSWKLLRR
ncbi:hypothetical protein MGWOODY_Tha801 [hydrothermal vent metagenome]|uniref:Uncharacterized protein n=1 Tax=hydrothermal vent metagenome TaxID=652676 RepID=A0A160TC09_9ZZZZ